MYRVTKRSTERIEAMKRARDAARVASDAPAYPAAYYEREQFGGWASDAGPSLTPNACGKGPAESRSRLTNGLEG